MTEAIDIRLPRLMDAELREICRIRPEKLGYTLNMVPLSAATLTMPLGEAEASVGQFMELYDTQGSIGVYRVEGVSSAAKQGGSVTLTLKHALCTIEDGIVFGYREFGGTGVKLRAVLASLLALQPVRRWQLGTVDYTTEFQYSFENESNLLSAVLSTAEPLSDEYLWTCDFSTAPWTLNLITAPEGDACEMRMNRNIDSVKIDVDRDGLCTRIYPLGYGEGVNQLTIAGINNGRKYLEDTAAQAKWGIVELPHAETTITDAGTLRGVAQGILDARKEPKVTVTVNGMDLSALTGEPFDRFYVGRKCRVPLPDWGTAVDERVVSIQKNDVFGDNTKVTVTLANKGADAVGEMASLSRKTAVGELYSQGATNQYAVHYADNADEGNALDCEFYIDRNAVWINSVMCKFKAEGFRAYSKGAKSGGGSTGTGNSGNLSIDISGTFSKTSKTSTPLEPGESFGKIYTDSGGAGDAAHVHKYIHEHSVYVEIPAKSYEISGGSHSHSLPEHAHDIEYGIYRGPTASGVAVKVDGTAVPASAIANGEFDAVPYLSKDSEGKITRGTWHRITFTPDGQTRIVADLHVKTFIRSITGGNY